MSEIKTHPLKIKTHPFEAPISRIWSIFCAILKELFCITVFYQPLWFHIKSRLRLPLVQEGNLKTSLIFSLSPQLSCWITVPFHFFLAIFLLNAWDCYCVMVVCSVGDSCLQFHTSLCCWEDEGETKKVWWNMEESLKIVHLNLAFPPLNYRLMFGCSH